MSGKYYDVSCAVQVIGDILVEPTLLDNPQYKFRDTDFDSDFHKVIFGTIYNCHQMGDTHLTVQGINDYLKDRPESYAIYKTYKGDEWVTKAVKNADPQSFNFNYQRLKKMTLLRTYTDIGVDVSYIYDPDNIIDLAKKQKQIEEFDKATPEELAERIENRIVRVKEVVVDDDIDESRQASEGAEELLEKLQNGEAIGYPLFDPVTDKITRGARLGCFYLRSAATGVGKSRSMMADACYNACSQIYDNKKQRWIDTGEKIPTCFISVELDMEELQTLCWSFIADVPEDHIIENKYDFDEMDRVKKAIEILKDSPLYFEYLPDYSLKDIENTIKRNIRNHKCIFIVLDYLTSSMTMLQEVSQATNGTKIREDQILLFLSSKLKDIAQTFHVFILSATQITSAFKHERILDQTMLSGAKAIANRIDVGMIMVDCEPEDLEDIEGISQQTGIQPNIKCSVYKNRRGKTNRVLLWMKADKGTCRYKTAFVTDFNLNLLDAKDL